jgi:hypothetical protein
MGSQRATKILAVVATAIVLVQLSPLTTGKLLCIGDGEDPDCCSESPPLLDRAECDCCITAQATPSTVCATSHKASSFETVSGSKPLQDVAAPTSSRMERSRGRDPGGSSLSSLRTVVLLI